MTRRNGFSGFENPELLAPEMETSGGVASEEEIVEEAPRNPDLDGVFEIVEESEAATPAPAPEDPTISKLKGLYDEQQRRLDATQGENSSVKDTLAQGFTSLADSIKGMMAQQAMKPGETPDEFKARIEKTVFDKPFDAMSEIVQRASGPINERIVMNQFKMGRKVAVLSLEPEEKALFTKYESEVENEFNKIPIQTRFEDPVEAYNQAFVNIKARHLREILADERKKIETSAVQSSAAAPAAQKAPPAATPYGFVEGSRPAMSPRVAASASPAKKITLLPGQRSRIEALMTANNLEVNDKNFKHVVMGLYESGDLRNV